MFVAAITVNIGVLVFFKVVAGKNGLPLGISFYTFQVMSYLIDVYQGEHVKDSEKSVALSILFQSDTHTLKEDEINTVFNNIIQAIEKECKAVLRS